MISSSNLGGSTIVTIFKGFTCPANTNFVAFSRYFEGTLSLAAVLIPSLVSELSSLDEKYNKAKYVQRHVCFGNVQVPCPHSNVYVKLLSRLCMKMSSFLFVGAWAVPRILSLSCGIPYPVWTPGIISGLTSVMVWLSW